MLNYHFLRVPIGKILKFLNISNVDLAIIVKTYPGKDGHVRAVDLRCNGHVYNRDFSKLVKLFSPTSDEQSSSSFVGEDVEDQRS